MFVAGAVPALAAAVIAAVLARRGSLKVEVQARRRPLVRIVQHTAA
jgi:hypothetical protein